MIFFIGIAFAVVIDTQPLKVNMLEDTHLPSIELFSAEKAYDLCAFDKQKRYTIHQITAHELDERHPNRAEVEAFIYQVFYQAYGAKVKNFMPKLIALRDEKLHLMAAFGMRPAQNNSLFLEQYLDEPIEAVISKSLNQVIKREEITEIGNLAVNNPRNAGILIAHVIQHSIDVGVKWCVATAHQTLQNGLRKGGCDVFPIHSVDPMRLPANVRADWGSYYENRPQVIAVRNKVI